MKLGFLDKVEDKIKKLARIFNDIAGWALVAAMVLVVANIILRSVFKSPILGTYEYTGFLTALTVGFGISFCLVMDAHISIDFITQKFPQKVQKVLGTVTNSVMLIMMGALTFNIIKYALKLAKSNSVSTTTQFPFYIVVFIVGICFLMMSLVLLVRIKENIDGGASDES